MKLFSALMLAACSSSWWEHGEGKVACYQCAYYDKAVFGSNHKFSGMWRMRLIYNSKCVGSDPSMSRVVTVHCNFCVEQSFQVVTCNQSKEVYHPVVFRGCGGNTYMQGYSPPNWEAAQNCSYTARVLNSNYYLGYTHTCNTDRCNKNSANDIQSPFNLAPLYSQREGGLLTEAAESAEGCPDPCLTKPSSLLVWCNSGDTCISPANINYECIAAGQPTAEPWTCAAPSTVDWTTRTTTTTSAPSTMSLTTTTASTTETTSLTTTTATAAERTAFSSLHLLQAFLLMQFCISFL